MITSVNNFDVLLPIDGMQVAAALEGNGFLNLFQSIVCFSGQNKAISTEQESGKQNDQSNAAVVGEAVPSEDEKADTAGDIKQTMLTIANPLLQYNNTDITALAASVNSEDTVAIISEITGVSGSTDSNCSLAAATTQSQPGQAGGDVVGDTGFTYQLPSSAAADRTVLTILTDELSVNAMPVQGISKPDATLAYVEYQSLTEAADLRQQNVSITSDGVDANNVYSQMKLQKSAFDIVQGSQAAISDSIGSVEQKPAVAQGKTGDALAAASPIPAALQSEETTTAKTQTGTDGGYANSDQQQTATAIVFSQSNKDKVTDAADNKIDFSKHLSNSVLFVTDVTTNQISELSASVNDAVPAFAQITDKITETLKDDGSKSFKLSLYPEGLGEVQITLKCQDSQLAVEITTDNPLTQKLLESQAQDLKAALATKNYEVQVMNINTKEATYLSASNSYDFFESKSGGGLSGQNQNNVAYGHYDAADGNDQETTQTESFYSGQLSIWA